jgi:hypothetical protein
MPIAIEMIPCGRIEWVQGWLKREEEESANFDEEDRPPVLVGGETGDVADLEETTGEETTDSSSKRGADYGWRGQREREEEKKKEYEPM